MGLGMRIDFENPMGIDIGMGITFENGYECGYNSTHVVPASRPFLFVITSSAEHRFSQEGIELCTSIPSPRQLALNPFILGMVALMVSSFLDSIEQ